MSTRADRPRTAPGPVPLGFLLASVGQQTMSTFRTRLEAHGVHPRAFAVLWALSGVDELPVDGSTPGRENGRSQQDLSRSLRIPASRLVFIIDDLERQGLVTRSAHPRDRRAHTVRLTGAGRQAAATLSGEAVGLEQQLTAGLTETDLAQLRRQLIHIADNLRAGDEPETQLGALRIW